MSKLTVEIDQLRDGTLVLSCGEGMERDLVFASGAMTGDPDLDEQRKILEIICKAVNQGSSNEN